MKAKLKVLLPGFTGNMDDVVIYYNSKLNKYIVRKKVKPKFTQGYSQLSDLRNKYDTENNRDSRSRS